MFAWVLELHAAVERDDPAAAEALADSISKHEAQQMLIMHKARSARMVDLLSAMGVPVEASSANHSPLLSALYRLNVQAAQRIFQYGGLSVVEERSLVDALIILLAMSEAEAVLFLKSRQLHTALECLQCAAVDTDHYIAHLEAVLGRAAADRYIAHRDLRSLIALTGRSTDLEQYCLRFGEQVLRGDAIGLKPRHASKMIVFFGGGQLSAYAVDPGFCSDVCDEYVLALQNPDRSVASVLALSSPGLLYGRTHAFYRDAGRSTGQKLVVAVITCNTPVLRMLAAAGAPSAEPGVDLFALAATMRCNEDVFEALEALPCVHS